MPTFLENVTVGDLPREIQKRFHLGQTRRTQSVTIQLEENPHLDGKDLERMSFWELSDISDRIGAEAQKKGLTPEKIGEILEIDKERG